MSRSNTLFLMLAVLLTATSAKSASETEIMPPSGAQRFLAEGELTLAPMAWIRFCVRNPAQCRIDGASKVDLTEEKMAELEQVNIRVNRRIRETPDQSARDTWDIDVVAGDCDDYAVQKRKELIALGWPPRSLSLAMGYARGVPHLVLTVRTGNGDLVLDNLRGDITHASTTGYRWLKRQSPENPYYWVAVVPQRKGDQVARAKRSELN
jgi:predicted transglutaminase-like cysteine proteinase